MKPYADQFLVVAYCLNSLIIRFDSSENTVNGKTDFVFFSLNKKVKSLFSPLRANKAYI